MGGEGQATGTGGLLQGTSGSEVTGSEARGGQEENGNKWV